MALVVAAGYLWRWAEGASKRQEMFRLIKTEGFGQAGTALMLALEENDRDVEVLNRAPWGDDGERCEEDIPELIAKRLYARAARNAAALASAGHRGTFTTRRPERMALRIDSSGGSTGPEQRPQG